MNPTGHIHLQDLLGLGRLAVDGTVRATDLAETVHRNIARDAAGPIPDLVYSSVRTIAGVVGGGMDALLPSLMPLQATGASTPEREAWLAALNGVMGDYLAATRNPLAIAMCLRHKGRPLSLETQALSAAIPHASRKLLLLVHGLCMNDRQWTRKGRNHGSAIARHLGYTPVHLLYNCGLHISTNGRAFAHLLEALLDEWPVPVEEFAILAHSLGGLVSRSACYYGKAADHRWPRRLRKLVFLGTPHHGAPLERGGNCVDVALQLTPYTAPFVRLGRMRSAGITDLRYGNLLDEDWQGRDRFEHSGDRRRPVPLPDRVKCYAMAAATGRERDSLGSILFGDGLVPVDSALGRHRDSARCLPFPASRQWVGYGMNHWDLLHKPAVYRQLARWLA